MLDLRKVSLLAVDTKNPELALWSMLRCLAVAQFAEAVLVTAPAFERSSLARSYTNQGIKILATDSIQSIEDYSRFMLLQAGDFVESPYVLVMQWDSFIVHPDQWAANFLHYDYIGPLWRDKKGRYRVGNGGFSLRSRRLLSAVKAISPTITHPEDTVIGRDLRDQLVRDFGISFPSEELAERFAFEREQPKLPSFGFHRFANFPLVLSKADLAEFLALAPDSMVTKRGVFRFVRNACKQGMSDIAREVIARRQRAGNGSWISTQLLLAWCVLSGSLTKRDQ